MEEYRAQGYTVFEGLYDETTMQTWRDEQDRLQALSTTGPDVREPTTWFGNMLERAPELMWPAVAHPVILDFAEQVVGPLVQLDNLTLAAFPSMDPEEAAGKASAWHRDRWARMPSGAYERPLAFNAICYLQDLDDEYGPLRVLPSSHVEPIALAEEEVRKPHQDELLIHMKAGDVVLTHNGLLHSGRPIPRDASATSSVCTTISLGSNTRIHSPVPTANSSSIGPGADRTTELYACWVRTITCKAAPTAVSCSPTKCAGISGPKPTSVRLKRPPDGNSARVDSSAVVESPMGVFTRKTLPDCGQHALLVPWAATQINVCINRAPIANVSNSQPRHHGPFCRVGVVEVVDHQFRMMAIKGLSEENASCV